MTRQIHRCTRVSIRAAQAVQRRDFFRLIGLGGLTAGSLNWVDLVTAQADDLRRRGMACILLWMQGGPSQFETFAPKPGHANGGETRAIATSVPGIHLADNLSNLAQVMNHLAVIRSVTSREGSHPRATYLLHTGYLPTTTVQFPSLGALVAHEIGDPACELPSFVRIGGRGGSGRDGGLLGAQFDPFEMNNPGTPPTNTRPTTDAARYQRRLDLLQRLEADFAAVAPREVREHQQLYQSASRMIMSRHMKTFDLSAESLSVREAYGRSSFGTGCLLARRLVEAGVSNGWDTHVDNFTRTGQLARQIDRPFAQLVRDLADRGMLERTLVIWMGEFGRTPSINPRAGRDHFPRAFSVALAGGGVRGGQVIGETDAGGVTIRDRPVTVPDLFQTFCHSLGIDADRENISPIGRPIKIVDGGSVVEEVFRG
jgi:hypothetical protein